MSPAAYPNLGGNVLIVASTWGVVEGPCFDPPFKFCHVVQFGRQHLQYTATLLDHKTDVTLTHLQ